VGSKSKPGSRARWALLGVAVNKNVEEILGKLKSGDLLNQISGMDETKELIEHLIHQAVQTLFECDSTSR
jgi:hypothetical protein